MSEKMNTQDHDIDIDFEPAPPDRLHAHHRRQLSAMLDGELSPDQARFMMRRLEHDASLAACWERWQVCGEVLRGHGHPLLPADFSARVLAAAVAAPATAPAAASAATAAAPRARLLRWGGGALAASVALVALFMARQLPEAQAPGALEAATSPSLVAEAPAAPGAHQAAPSQPSAPAAGGGARTAAEADPASALLAAAPVLVAAAEVPRRAAGGGTRGTSRSQSQRAAVRRSQAAAQAPVQVAAASSPAIAAPGAFASTATAPGLLAAVPAEGNVLEGGSLFGGLPEPAARPWPRATLPGLSGRQPFAAGYGLPQADVFAPFQPRLERAAAPRVPGPAPAPASPDADDAATGEREAGGPGAAPGNPH